MEIGRTTGLGKPHDAAISAHRLGTSSGAAEPGNRIRAN
jgi:hypothetical protein